MSRSHELDDLLDLLGKLLQLARTPPNSVSETQLREIKILWQVVLGIDEHLFKSDDYANLSLDITTEFNQKSFQCLRYLRHGDEIDRGVSSDIVNSMGDVQLTQSLIRSIEEETTERSEEITERLSLINKMRIVLYKLSHLTEKLSNRADLVNFVSNAYEYEIFYHRKAGILLDDTNSDVPQNEEPLVPLLFDAHNKSFNSCYKEGLLMLTASLSRDSLESSRSSKILKASKLTVDTFIKLNNISIVYDLQRVSELHLDIFNIIKYPVRNSPYKDELGQIVDDYFSFNPIFPIMKPIIRQFLESEERRDPSVKIKSEEDSSSWPTGIRQESVQGEEFLSLLSLIVEAYVLNSDKTVPLPVQWFPQVFKSYIGILEEDGQSLESDIYYRDVKNATMKWRTREVTSKSFSEELLTLSLIPSSELFVYRGITLPTPEMRYALVRIKNFTELKSKYIRVWFDVATYSKTNRSLMSIWEKSFKQAYLKRWFDKVEQNKSKQQIALQFDESFVKNSALSLWDRKLKEKLVWENKADLFFQRRSLRLWLAKTNELRQSFNERRSQYDKLMKQRFFDTWRVGSTAHNSKLSELNDLLVIKMAMQLWKQSYRKLAFLDSQADTFKGITAQSTALANWKSRSNETITKLKHLQKNENKFVVTKTLRVWVNSYNYRILEREVRKNNDTHLMDWAFGNWKRGYAYEKLAIEFRHRGDQRIVRKYLKNWSVGRQMNTVADDFSEQALLRRSFKKWKLILQESKMALIADTRLAEKSLSVWRMNTRAHVFIQGRNDALKREVLRKWQHELKRCSELALTSEKTYGELRSRTVLRFWVQRHRKNSAMAADAEDWCIAEQEKRRLMWLAETFDTWLSNLYSVVDRVSVLNESLAVFESSYGIGSKTFGIWRARLDQHRQEEKEAGSFRELTLVTKTLNKWIQQYDRLLELEQICDNHLEVKNVDILSNIVSQLSLKSIKTQTDLKNADLFKDRWNRNRLKTFFDMWKIGYEEKHEMNNVALFPTLTGETAAESTQVLSPLAHRRNQLTMLRMNSQTDLSIPADGSGTPVAGSTFTSPNRIMRTPATTSKMGFIPATERVRRMYLEQRKSQYRQVKHISPEKRNELSTPTRRPGASVSFPTLGQLASSRSALSSTVENTEERMDDSDNVFIQRAV